MQILDFADKPLMCRLRRGDSCANGLATNSIKLLDAATCHALRPVATAARLSSGTTPHGLAFALAVAAGRRSAKSTVVDELICFETRQCLANWQVRQPRSLHATEQSLPRDKT